MTTSKERTTHTSEAASATAQLLTPVVHDLIALAVAGKQAHWHVRGPNFVSVHRFLDKLVHHVNGWADTAAERIVALGLPVDARLGSVAARASLPEQTAGFRPAEAAIGELLEGIDAVRANLDHAIAGLEGHDPASQDVAIEIRRGLDKDRWFLFSHVAVR